MSIHSREPDSYILSVIGRGRLNFLLQVKDEDHLLHWFALFDNKHGSNYSRSNCHSKTNSNVQKSNVSNVDSKCSYLNETMMMPMSHLPMGLLQTRGESDETLHAALHGFHQMAPHPLTRNNSSPSPSSTGGRSEKDSPRRGDSDYAGYVGMRAGSQIQQSPAISDRFTASPRASLQESRHQPGASVMAPPSRQNTDRNMRK